MTDTAQDHFQLEDTGVTRRYFDKFERIIGHLARVAGVLEAENRLSKRDVEVMTRYIVGLNYTFAALAHKYHFSGRLGPWPMTRPKHRGIWRGCDRLKS